MLKIFFFVMFYNFFHLNPDFLVKLRQFQGSALSRVSEYKPENIGGSTFETFQLCRMCSILVKPIGEVQGSSSKKFNVGNVFIAKKFDTCKGLLKKFDIYSKIVDRDVGNFVPHPDKLVLRHPFRVSNFSVNFIYSVWPL